ncbi:MAG: hypothetical protein EAX96_14855 [Candidatus Lokiarchaeota archaeon]|nr:hypothetical protein [Candidatus Lokiarchaeota archaeon]
MIRKTWLTIIVIVILLAIPILFTWTKGSNPIMMASSPLTTLDDTSDVDYFQIDPYSIAGDTNLENLNDSNLIKLVQQFGVSGTECTLSVDVFFLANSLPETIDVFVLDFRLFPYQIASGSCTFRNLSVQLYQYETSWAYEQVFNATSSSNPFKIQDASSQVTLHDVEKIRIVHDGYVKFKVSFMVMYTTNQSSIDLWLMFYYLKLLGGNNLEFVKICPEKTSFGAGVGESVRVEDEPQALILDGAGNYLFQTSHQALMSTEDQASVDFHLAPLGDKTQLIFDVLFDLDDYVLDDVFACEFHHHEHFETNIDGSYQGISIQYYDGTAMQFLSVGNTADDPLSSMFPQENEQTMLLPLTPTILSSRTIRVRYSINFQVSEPATTDYVTMDLDIAYILLVRPLRPLIQFQEGAPSTPIFEPYTVSCNYPIIDGVYPHPITKLEVYKDGGYHEVSFSEQSDSIIFTFLQIGSQDYHFKVSFGSDYYCTEPVSVEVTKRARTCVIDFHDEPNNLHLLLVVKDALNGTLLKDTLVDINVFHWIASGWTTIVSDAIMTDAQGSILLDLNVTGSYYLHQYYASFNIAESLYHQSYIMATPILTCTNCTPTITITNTQLPDQLKVLNPTTVEFFIETLQPLNKSWILVDDQILEEIQATSGSNYVSFLGIKGMHVYQICVENILGEIATSEPFTMGLHEAPATLFSTSSVVGNTLQLTFYVEDDLGAKIAVPVKIEIRDQGILLLAMVLESSTTTISTCELSFDAFTSHTFEIYLIVNDTRYESEPISLTNVHQAIPLGAILVEACGSCALIGIGAVYFVKKRR